MQSSTPVVLGIDAGTTSVKTVVFNLSGEILNIARSSVSINRGQAGEAEASMRDVWLATVETVVAAMEPLRASEVLAIGITGQGDGAWLLDASDAPLRDAVLWLDGRAVARVEEWNLDGRGAAVKQATGSSVFAGAMPVLVEELQASQPEVMATLGGQLNCKDWIRFNMVGVRATDPSEASRTYLDTATLAYSDHLLEAIGQTYLKPSLPPVRNPYEIAGTLTDAAARTLQLAPGIPVAVGLVDTAAAGVGIGALNDGDGYLILGTTGFVGVNQPSRSDLRTDLGIVLATGRGTQVLECLSPMTGTPNLDWVRGTLRVSDRDWQDVEEDARSVELGSGGVIFLPYGSPSGERAPFVDGDASAAWLGMSVTTTAAELLRSVYEGLAYSLTECIELLGLSGTVSICGGGSDSDLLCEILADVSGVTIIRQDEPEVGARGSASIALLASGHAESLAGAVAMLAPKSSSFEPDPERHRYYRRAFAVFLSTRDAIRPHWAAMRDLRL